MESLLRGGARAVLGLAPTVLSLGKSQEEEERWVALVGRVCDRGYFTPEEDDLVRTRFAAYLTARAALQEIIVELSPIALEPSRARDEETQIKCFVLAYSAAGLLVHAAKFLTESWANDPVIARKLNEPAPRYRIPRKQYTAVYRSLTSPANAWRLAQAQRFAAAHRDDIDHLQSDPVMGSVVEILKMVEEEVKVDAGHAVLGRVNFRWHSFRRRRASAYQQGLFWILETFGRRIADMRWKWRKHRVQPVFKRLSRLLEPGDVIVARHDRAMSNLFLPGYWPHAALHIGEGSVQDRMEIVVDTERGKRWDATKRVLEARKDGVLFRELSDTLAVDAVAVIRPEIGERDIARALSRVLTHEGKLYNFDFDFFRTDRLVCTEVVYRAYDGIGGMEFKLKERAGRLTFSAEDLLDMAVEGRGFKPVAVYGAPNCRRRLKTGADAMPALIGSYR